MPRIASLSKIKAQIATLEAKAKKIENVGKPGVAQVVKLMKKYKLTAADLQGAFAGKSKAPAKQKKSKLAGKKAAVKYRDTKGNTWAGRGLAPKWLKAAEKAGQKRDTFLV